LAEVFISYDAPTDRERAARIAGALERTGRTVWWDRELKVGVVWETMLNRQLEAAKAVVVIWTPSSVRSGWVRQEAVEGMRRGALVPVLMAGLREPPMGFQGVQAAELTGWLGDATPAWLDVCLAIDGLCA
jgi:hypothetical protein